eukprot:Tbor_TRINITY_DN5723_c3_g4::TRINITY_DN5723_c3_g4_i1::g.20538::m.20538/K02206/CDK2; cyclin-dependent kinase 2
MMKIQQKQQARSPSSSQTRERYTAIEKVGEGTYGVVFKCLDNSTGYIVAQKRIRLDPNEEGVPSTAIREIALLKEIKHRNVVHLLDVLCLDRKLILVFEFLNQDLKALMDSRPSPFEGRQLKILMYQLVDGILACHSRRVIHRDMKPQNILVANDGLTLKIADFGLARAFRIPTCTYTHEVVTLWYRAPEILLGCKHYLPAVDIWSIGCIFAELASKRPLFPGDSEIHQLYSIFRILGTPCDNIWDGVIDLPDFNPSFPKWEARDLSDVIPGLDAVGIDLMKQMLVYHPHERIHAYAALQHPWFDDIRPEMKAIEGASRFGQMPEEITMQATY